MQRCFPATWCLLVAIEPNNPEAGLLNETGYTDVGDSLEEIKIRSESPRAIDRDD